MTYIAFPSIKSQYFSSYSSLDFYFRLSVLNSTSWLHVMGTKGMTDNLIVSLIKITRRNYYFWMKTPFQNMYLRSSSICLPLLSMWAWLQDSRTVEVFSTLLAECRSYTQWFWLHRIMILSIIILPYPIMSGKQKVQNKWVQNWWLD